jgi:hypothetical protein
MIISPLVVTIVLSSLHSDYLVPVRGLIFLRVPLFALHLLNRSRLLSILQGETVFLLWSK